MGIEIFKKHIREKRAIKIVCGDYNLNLDNIAKICRASQRARASAVDVACNKDVIEIAKKNTKLPIFASSMHPFELLQAVKCGVDAIEIGTFLNTYKQGKSYTYDETREIVLETLALVNQYDIYKSVTLPSCLKLHEQIKLTKELEVLGVDLIQTEGYKLINPRKRIIAKDSLSSIERAVELSKYTRIPVMATCAINKSNALDALNNGVDAISVGSAVSKCDTEIEMVDTISSIARLVSHRNSINREIVRNSIELLKY